MKLAKRLNEDQKGLTLIELLAVIVILGIIAAIAIPSISAVIKNSERKAQVSNAHQIIDSARLMIASKGFTNSGAAGSGGATVERKITLADLIAEGFINGDIKDPYDKTQVYDTTSTFVNVKRTSTTNSSTGITTDTFDYRITVVSPAATGAYYDNVAEADLEDMNNGGVHVDEY